MISFLVGIVIGTLFGLVLGACFAMEGNNDRK